MSDYPTVLGNAADAFGPSSLAVANERLLEDGHTLRLRSAYNVRELGGFDSPRGTTLRHRFLRSGATRSLTQDDLDILRAWGVTRVADLRSLGESPQLSCRFARQDWVTWENVPLYDYDMSAPAMTPVRDVGGYFVSGYLHMLTSHAAIRRLFEFFAQAGSDECVLFHCAAGMDRTGMVAMLLLGLAEVPRSQIIADYLYSFGKVAEVDGIVFGGKEPVVREGFWNPIPSRLEAITFMLDRIEGGYGTARAFLSACDVDDACLDAVRGMLVGTD